MHRGYKNALGFTFLEIVAAMAVLAIGIVAAITLFPIGLENSKRASERTRASLLVYQELQRYRSMGFLYVTTVLSPTQGTAQAFTMGDPYFVNFVTVQPYAGVPATSLQQVTCRAEWPSTQADRNKRRSLEMSTLISDRG